MIASGLSYTFGWDLCYTCNYRCPYCGVWENKSEKDLVFSTDEWVIVWDRIFDKYGSCRIFMSGGEPATYPFFYDLVKKLTRKHFVDICTNLSWETDRIIPEVSSENLKISATFHPYFADFEDFFQKVVKIKEYLSNLQIFYVAYSAQIEEMPERSIKLKEQGINLIPLPLRGNQVVLNTEKEKRVIEEITPYSGEKREYQLQRISPKGKLCRAGQLYAVIRADGQVDRCSQYHSGEIGNLLAKDFQLFEEPRTCDKEYCPIESQWIIN
jgi:MoaA/NifB/PqqE/SkfB family radical SAM enzyme